MLTLNEIKEFRGLLLSERLTLRGNELLAMMNLLNALDREERAINNPNINRVTPVVVPVPDQKASGE
jgi:hypothetical protein